MAGAGIGGAAGYAMGDKRRGITEDLTDALGNIATDVAADATAELASTTAATAATDAAATAATDAAANAADITTSNIEDVLDKSDTFGDNSSLNTNLDKDELDTIFNKDDTFDADSSTSNSDIAKDAVKPSAKIEELPKPGQQSAEI